MSAPSRKTRPNLGTVTPLRTSTTAKRSTPKAKKAKAPNPARLTRNRDIRSALVAALT